MLNIRHLSSLTLLFISISLSGQITYVDQDASGSNNGTSWTNAYNNLDIALENTNTGQIWVAEGVYIPSGVDSSATFLIESEIEIYGGFDGSESNLSERDYEINPTVLSGDVSGNDIQSDFDQNKSDNLLHVVVVDSFLGVPIIVDGLIIQGGNTSDDNTFGEYFWRGGGIFAYSSVAIANCNFENNFARSGAGVYITPNAGGGNGSSFDNCNFSYNYSTSQSAGIFLSELEDISVSDCSFTSNATTRGAFYPAYCNNIIVDNCLFDNNETAAFADYGGAVFIWQSTNFTISNTVFTNNIAGNAGVIYHDGREIDADATNLVLDNCELSGNTAQDWGGGAIYVFSGSMTITDCAFNQNIATNSGGHVFFGGDNKEIIIMNSEFEGGAALFGGAHNCYGENANYTIVGNTYTANNANTSGGAVINGFRASVSYEDCLFEDNEAQFGGVMYNQNDTTELYINNCEFKGNVASDGSGGVHISGIRSAVINDSYFEANIGGDGGALFMAEFDAVEESTLNMFNTEFNFNQATLQGGAISISDIDVEMINCLIINNASPDGAGGGLLNNATQDNTAQVNLMNTTFGNNASSLGGNIAQWTSDYNSFATMTMRNCLLATILGESYEIEGGTPDLISEGGNVVDDETAESFLTESTDINNAGDPLFADPFAFDFHLLAGSPAIDAGVAGAPEFDFDGNPRIGAPDAGAFEFQGIDNVTLIEFEESELSIYPNPIRTAALVELENNWRGSINWQIVDARGVLHQSGVWEKRTEKMIEAIQLKEVASGNYILILEFEGVVVSRKLVKR